VSRGSPRPFSSRFRWLACGFSKKKRWLACVDGPETRPVRGELAKWPAEAARVLRDRTTASPALERPGGGSGPSHRSRGRFPALTGPPSLNSSTRVLSSSAICIDRRRRAMDVRCRQNGGRIVAAPLLVAARRACTRAGMGQDDDVDGLGLPRRYNLQGCRQPLAGAASRGNSSASMCRRATGLYLW
jgi:hypothetical protein